jgi:hypothetical protein
MYLINNIYLIYYFFNVSKKLKCTYISNRMEYFRLKYIFVSLWSSFSFVIYLSNIKSRDGIMEIANDANILIRINFGPHLIFIVHWSHLSFKILIWSSLK